MFIYIFSLFYFIIISQTGRKLLWINEKYTEDEQLSASENGEKRNIPKFNCLTDPQCILSFLPWERGQIGIEAVQTTKRLDTIRQYESRNGVTGRRLLDSYSSSLLHVSRIYNKAFGYKARKVPAHMPHMVDRDVIYEMQTRFLPYFEATSSHKLRHGEDMQFAFSFNYYVDGVKKSKNLDEVFNEIDTDKSGMHAYLLFFLNFFDFLIFF